MYFYEKSLTQQVFRRDYETKIKDAIESRDEKAFIAAISSNPEKFDQPIDEVN